MYSSSKGDCWDLGRRRRRGRGCSWEHQREESSLRTSSNNNSKGTCCSLEHHQCKTLLGRCNNRICCSLGSNEGTCCNLVRQLEETSLRNSSNNSIGAYCSLEHH